MNLRTMQVKLHGSKFTKEMSMKSEVVSNHKHLKKEQQFSRCVVLFVGTYGSPA